MQKILVQDQIAAEIRRRIVAGVYPIGELIPPERVLAKELHTSRRTIGKTLSELAERGVLVRSPGKGTRVVDVDDRPSQSSVAIILPTSPHYGSKGSAIIQGMQQRLAELNQRCELVYNAMTRPAITAKAISERYAGALFVEGLGIEEMAVELEQQRHPCIVANIEKDMAVSGSWIDHAKSTQTAVELLVAFGHRRIAILTRPLDMFFYRKAVEGYRRGLSNADIAFNPKLVVISEGRDVPTDSVSAYMRMRDFLKTNPVPTGLVACRDYLANGAYQALVEAGYQVGRDVSLVGFDDLSWPQSAPFLTTFSEPPHELGAIAAEMLVERLISGWRPIEKREVEAPLIIRKSAGPHLESKRLNHSPVIPTSDKTDTPSEFIAYRSPLPNSVSRQNGEVARQDRSPESL